MVSKRAEARPNQLISVLADGTLDTSYGQNGYLVAAVAKFFFEDDHANVAWFRTQARFKLDAQQRLLVGVPGTIEVQYTGSQTSGHSLDIIDPPRIVRYDVHGHPDNTFGVAGRITLGKWDAIWQMEQYPDGRLLVATTLAPGGPPPGNGVSVYSAHLKRFLADGTVDTSFGNSGDVDVGTVTIRDIAFVLEENGAITVASDNENSVSDDAVVVSKFTKDGALDTSFAKSGRVTVPANIQIGSATSTICLARSSSGRLAISIFTGKHGAVLAMLTPAGVLDIQFAPTGILSEPVSPDWPVETSDTLAFDASGNVLQASLRYSTAHRADYNIRRYTPAGTRTLDLHNMGAWSSFTVAPDGRLLMAGTTSNGDLETPTFARFWP